MNYMRREKEKTIMSKKNNTGRTYMMTGATGELYAGQTTQPVTRRVSQHKHNKKLSNKMFLYAQKYGIDSLSLLSSTETSVDDLNTSEQALIDNNGCITSGLNTNNAPKHRNRNEFIDAIHSVSGRYTLGDAEQYRLSDVLDWAHTIARQSGVQFDYERFVRFITASAGQKDEFFVDMVGAGAGYYTKRSWSSMQDMLIEDPSMCKNVMFFTNRYFFKSADDKKVLSRLNKTAKQLRNTLNQDGALSRVPRSKEIAKYLGETYEKLINEKTTLEKNVRELALMV